MVSIKVIWLTQHLMKLSPMIRTKVRIATQMTRTVEMRIKKALRRRQDPRRAQLRSRARRSNLSLITKSKPSEGLQWSSSKD